ncbi:MAG: hypothetical protein WBA25_19405, partial [Jannaschia sp.]
MTRTLRSLPALAASVALAIPSVPVAVLAQDADPELVRQLARDTCVVETGQDAGNEVQACVLSFLAEQGVEPNADDLALGEPEAAIEAPVVTEEVPAETVEAAPAVEAEAEAAPAVEAEAT